MKTRRPYFLDYPCDLKSGEKVTLVLSLHGGGSYGNWQRHYFPIMDYKDKYRLVIATPNAPTRAWSAAMTSIFRISSPCLSIRLAAEYQGILAGRTFSGWDDFQPPHSHGLLQGQSGWMAESLGRQDRGESRASNELWTTRATAASGNCTGAPASGCHNAPAGPLLAPAGMAAAAAALRELPDTDFSFHL
jgi:hypothetical protein